MWRITMVDATFVRHHPRAYDAVIAGRALGERQQIVEALAGLRYVRNQIGQGAPLGELIDTGAGSRRITGWAWKPGGEPDLARLPRRAQAWELARYRAYQARLVGCTVGEIFGRVVTFLTLTGQTRSRLACTCPPPPPGSEHPGRR